MGDTGSNRGDCTRLLWSCNSLADPISDLLSQVKKANERFGGEATDGPWKAGSVREDSRQLEKMYWYVE